MSQAEREPERAQVFVQARARVLAPCSCSQTRRLVTERLCLWLAARRNARRGQLQQLALVLPESSHFPYSAEMEFHLPETEKLELSRTTVLHMSSTGSKEVQSKC